MDRASCRAAIAAVILCLSAHAQATDATARIEGWRADLRAAREEWLAADRSFSVASRRTCEAGLAALEDRLATLRDEAVVVELARLAALAGNAHTRVYLLRNRAYVRRVPLRFWWFAGELRVVATAPEHAAVAGARVVRLCNRSLAEVRRAVNTLYAGTAGWLDYMSVYTLSSPEVLVGLGFLEPGAAIPIVFETGDGTRLERSFEPMPRAPLQTTTEDWRNLSPRALPSGWRSALDEHAVLPPSLAEPEVDYRRQRLDGDVLYVKVNRSPGDRREAFATFLAECATELADDGVRGVIVDLRTHTGGDLSAGERHFETLADAARRHRRRLVVLTSGVTFSAGLFHAVQLLRHPDTRWVGEAPGDELTFWAEGGNVELPHAQLTMHYSNRLHLYADREPTPDESALVCRHLRVPSLPTRTDSALDWASYVRGEDPCLRQALAQARE